ncbi:MAG: hypothetical protein JWQ11_1485 [Rhizobacter sp.]|nr:hypothetical protein [Rhizobacter sp.]
MNSSRHARPFTRTAVCLAALWFVGSAAFAQSAPGLAVPPPPPTVADLPPAPVSAATAPAAATTPTQSANLPDASDGIRGGEPKVQVSVVEDDRVRIEETRVRGQTQRIIVKPKGAIKGEYEILPADGGRDMTESAYDSRVAAGKRVWRMFSF